MPIRLGAILPILPRAVEKRRNLPSVSWPGGNGTPMYSHALAPWASVRRGPLWRGEDGLTQRRFVLCRQPSPIHDGTHGEPDRDQRQDNRRACNHGGGSLLHGDPNERPDQH